MNSHTGLQQNHLESLIKFNYRTDTDMNETLQNVAVISVSGVLNSHTLPQTIKLSKLDEMNMSVDNVDVNGDYCYMNSSTVFVIRNHNSVDYMIRF